MASSAKLWRGKVPCLPAGGGWPCCCWPAAVKTCRTSPISGRWSRATSIADQRSARPIIAGTVARGHLDADTYFYTGKIGSNDGDYLPFPVTAEVLARGQQRFNIYCSPCHGELGDGNGMIVQRGYKHPPSYHIERLRKAPIGYFFDVMTNGFGAMPDYSQQVQPADRWAIAAYIRALQLSQHATEADVPAGTQIANTPPPGVILNAAV